MCFSRPLVVVAYLFLALAPHTTWASGDKAALRTQQTALFQQMFAEPDNLDIMLSYAQVSAALEDYEAAISTLERILTYNSRIPAVRFELGALYFNIGAYGSARTHFETALASPALSDNRQVRARDYLGEIEKRTARSRLSGQAVAGIIASSNASVEPDNDMIFSAGTLVWVETGKSDTGAFGTLRLSHEYDINPANTDAWITEGFASATEFFDEDGGDLVSFNMRTGPSLSLKPEQYGPKLRPFVEGDYVYFGNQSLYGTLGAGAEYRNPLSDRWSVYGEAGVAHRFFFSDFDDEEGSIAKLEFGAAYKPTRDLTMNAAIGVRGDWAEEDFNSNAAAYMRAKVAWRYDPGLTFAQRKWKISADATVGYADYDEPEPAIDPSRAREQRIVSLGLTNDFHLRDGLFIRAEGRALWRDANIPNYDLSVYEARLGVGLDF